MITPTAPVPPHDTEAELHVLAAILLKPDIFPAVLELLGDAEPFYLDKHREIFAGMAACHVDGIPLDGVTVLDAIRRRGNAANVGVDDFVGLRESGATAPTWPHYTQIVREKFGARRQAAGLTRLLAAAEFGLTMIGETSRPLNGELVPIRDAVVALTAGAGAAGKPRFEIVDAAELVQREMPAQPELVVGRFLQSEFLANYGPPRRGKGMFAAGLCYSVATGVPLAEGFAVATPGVAVYLSLEDPEARIRERLRGFIAGYGVALPPDRLKILARPFPPPRFTDDSDVRALLRLLEPLRPVLLVIDNFARILHGADENAATEVMPILAGLERMRDTLGCALHLVHHVTKTERSGAFALRGSSAIPGACDGFLRVHRPDGGDTVDLTCHDRRDGAEWRASLRLVRSLDGGLRFDSVATPAEAAATLEEAEAAKVVSALRECAPMFTAGVPASLLEERTKLSRTTLGRRLTGLLSRRMVRSVPGRRGTATLWFPSS